MNRVVVSAARILAKTLTRKSYVDFVRALETPRKNQMSLLREILKMQAKTEYGQALGLTGNENEAEFREKVPISDFDLGSLSGWIEKQKRYPDQAVLSPGGIVNFEKTSGSSGPHKLIPYNRALLNSFDKYFRIWLYDILTHGPKFESFRLYMSISPIFRSESEIAQNIGLEDDSYYISSMLRLVMKYFFVVPTSLQKIQNPSIFFDLLCAYLAADEKLEILSLWHPSLFLSIWDHLIQRRQFIAALLDGSKKISGFDIPKNLKAASLLSERKLMTPMQLWPKLKFISAWDCSHSQQPAANVQNIFPHVYFQGKGLLATEAPMTLPLIDCGTLPFISDVLFEFIDDFGKYCWIDEIQAGFEYSLVLSQKGGLIRYKIGDRIRVGTSNVGNTPSLEFIGRENETSDLVGEKITSSFLESFDREFSRISHGSYYTFLPVLKKGPRYVLLVEKVSDDSGLIFSKWWEDKLCQNYHYSYARKLSQLDKLEVVSVPQLQKKLLDFYSKKKSMKLGDVKLKRLFINPQTAEEFLVFSDIAVGHSDPLLFVRNI